MSKDFKKFFFESIEENKPKQPEQNFDCKICDSCKYTATKIDKTIYPNYCPNCGNNLVKAKETQVLNLSSIKPLSIPVYESTMLNESAVSEIVANHLIKQVSREVSNAIAYINLSFKLNNEGFTGFANFCENQARGEFEHSQRIREYLTNRSANVVIENVEIIPTTFATNEGYLTPLNQDMEFVYKLEQKTTEEINKIVEIANQAKDTATINFLDWFLQEQIEEEKTVLDILNRVRLANGDSSALFTLDAMI